MGKTKEYYQNLDWHKYQERIRQEMDATEQEWRVLEQNKDKAKDKTKKKNKPIKTH